MPIVDESKPKLEAICDICGQQFAVPLRTEREKLHTVYGGRTWRDVSMQIFPNVYSMMYQGTDREFESPYHSQIKVDYACDRCREEFSSRVRGLIDEMRKH